FFLLPMLWMVFASVDSNPDWAIKLPTPTLANFTDVLGRADAISSFRSSLILAGTTTVVTTVLAVLAAYPLSRMHIPFKRAFMLPGTSVTAIYTFINAWGAFIIPFVLTYSPDNQPGPVEIYNFMGSHGLFKFGDLAVFSLLFSVPVIVLYLFMSRYFSGAFN